MPNFRKQRIAGWIVKSLFTLLIVAINVLIVWRVFFSANIPNSIGTLHVNDALREAYAENGGKITAQYQNQLTTTYGENNTGYFGVPEYFFIPEANQVQVVFRYNNSTLKNVARDKGLEKVPDKSEDIFDVTLVTTTDLTPDKSDDNNNTALLSMQRSWPSAVKRDETSLYTYYRFVFDNIEITPDMLYVFADIYYTGDLNYEEPAYGTLCLYDDQSPWVTYKLSRTERKMLERREDE